MTGAEKVALMVVSLLGLAALLGGSFDRGQSGKESPFLFNRSYSYNQQRGNQLTRQYVEDLLEGLPEGAILITDGADAEVFPLLYYSSVEGLRRDLNFFDQNGNIFPRLYGDLYDPPADLEIVKMMRDFQLYSMGRPVYHTWRKRGVETLSPESIRKEAKDRLDAIRRGGRGMGRFSVVGRFDLTSDDGLRRATNEMVPQTLFSGRLKDGTVIDSQSWADEGPWTLEKKGLLYQLRPFREQIVRIVRLYHGVDERTLTEELREIKEDITGELVRKELAFLVRHGDLQREGVFYFSKETITDTDEPTNSAKNLSQASFNRDYLNNPYSPHWDSLSKDVLINRLLKFIEGDVDDVFVMRKALDYWKRQGGSLASSSIAFLEKRIEELRGRITWQIERHEPYYTVFRGYDDMASIFLRLGLYDKAIAYLEKISSVRKNNFYAESSIAQIYQQKYREEEQSSHLVKALEHYRKALFYLDFYLKQRGRPVASASSEYQKISQGVQEASVQLKYPKNAIMAKEQFYRQKKSYGGAMELGEIYQEMGLTDRAIDYYDEALSMSSGAQSMEVWLRKYLALEGKNRFEESFVCLEHLVQNPSFRFINKNEAIYENLMMIGLHLVEKFYGEKRQDKVQTYVQKMHLYGEMYKDVAVLRQIAETYDQKLKRLEERIHEK